VPRLRDSALQRSREKRRERRRAVPGDELDGTPVGCVVAFSLLVPALSRQRAGHAGESTWRSSSPSLCRSGAHPLARHQNTSFPTRLVGQRLLRRASPGRRARASGLATTWVHRATAPTHRVLRGYLNGLPHAQAARLSAKAAERGLCSRRVHRRSFHPISFRIGACTVLVGSSDPENWPSWAQVPRRTPTTQVQRYGSRPGLPERIVGPSLFLPLGPAFGGAIEGAPTAPQDGEGGG